MSASKSTFDFEKAARGATPTIKRLVALCWKHCPTASLVKACQSTDWAERAAVARHPSTPESVSNVLAHDTHPVVRALAKHRNTSVKCNEFAVGLKDVESLTTENQGKDDFAPGDADSMFWLEVCNRVGEFSTQSKIHNVFLGMFDEFTTQDGADWIKYWKRANDPSTEDRELLQLARISNPMIWWALVQRKNLYQNAALFIAKNAGIFHCKALAKNAKTLPEVLTCLANRNDFTICQIESFFALLHAIVENPATPKNALESIARTVLNEFHESDVHYIHYRIAIHENVSPKTLELLAEDNHLGVRAAVATRWQVPEFVLEILSKDRNDEVRIEVANNPSTPQQALSRMASDADKFIRMRVAKNPNATISTQFILAEDQVSDVRQSLAESPHTSRNILETLAEDQYSRVRRAVAQNPSISLPIMEKLETDKDIAVRIGLARNASVDPVLSERLAKSRIVSVRLSVARNPNTSPTALAILAEDNDVNVRVCVAENPAITKEIVDLLKDDKNISVRTAISKTK